MDHRSATRLLLTAGLLTIALPASGQSLLHTLTPEADGGSHSYGQLGTVAVDGDFVVVGDSSDNDNGINSGSVSVYSAATGMRLYKIFPDDGLSASSFFGKSVDADGGFAVIGRADGSVYVYNLQDEVEVFKMMPAVADSSFGNAVALSGNIAVIGSANRAYVFNIETNTELFELIPSVAGGGFGVQVAIDGNTIVVGARDQPGGSSLEGAAFLFDAATGLQLFPLTADDAGNGDRFGWSVAVEGNRAFVGSPFDDEGGNNAGAVYIFDTTSGMQVDKLIASDAGANDNFGTSVAVKDGKLFVGSPKDNDPVADSGSVYLFSALAGAELLKITIPTSVDTDRLGSGLAADGDIAALGAEALQGVYVFDTDLTPVFLTQPVSAIVDTGVVGTGFTVSVDGPLAPQAYQWRFDGSPIFDGPDFLGATTDTLEVVPTINTEGTYDVVVFDGLNTIISDTAVLGVRNTFPADLNGDGVVDTADLGILLGVFGATGP